MTRTLADLSEAEVIALFAGPPAPPPPEVVVPNGDDAAAWLARPGLAQVITTDSLVEGVHFLRTVDPHALGHKLLAVNLSDLAAMGAEPRLALISVCLPHDLSEGYVRALGEGARAQAAAFGVHVIGGNVTRSPGPMVLGATLIGEVSPAQVLRRTGAVPGDRVLVSGALGHAHVALAALLGGHAVPASLAAALHTPTPRVALGRALAARGGVRAACDLSDGLARDLARMVPPPLGARIDVARLPMSDEARALAEALGLDPLQAALVGGEDYELLLLVPPGSVAAIEACARAEGVPLTDVGEVTATPGLVRSDGAPVGRGFEHFG